MTGIAVIRVQFIRQRIPKTMNSNITDNGTPNNHIITIRFMNQSLLNALSLMPPLRNGYDVGFASFLQRTPEHSAASMPLRRQNKYVVFSAPYESLSKKEKMISIDGGKDYKSRL